MTVFLDTVGLIAVWDEDDQWHSAADSCFARLQAEQVNFVTTNFVLLECGNAAARRPYRSAPSRLCKKLEQQGKLISPASKIGKPPGQITKMAGRTRRELWITFHSRSCGGWALPKRSPTTGIFAPPDLKTCFEMPARAFIFTTPSPKWTGLWKW